MNERPNVLIAATQLDATEVKREFPVLRSWHTMTPRNAKTSMKGWMFGHYTWTPAAQTLPARTRWDLRMRLSESIDKESEEVDFPTRVIGW